MIQVRPEICCRGLKVAAFAHFRQELWAATFTQKTIELNAPIALLLNFIIEYMYVKFQFQGILVK